VLCRCVSGQISQLRKVLLQASRSMKQCYGDRIRFITWRIFTDARRALSPWAAVRIVGAISFPGRRDCSCQGENWLSVAVERFGLEATNRCGSRCSSKQVGLRGFGSASRSSSESGAFAVNKASHNFFRGTRTTSYPRWFQGISRCRARRRSFCCWCCSVY